MVLPINNYYRRNNDEEMKTIIKKFLKITNFIYLFDFCMLLIIKGVKRFIKDECLSVKFEVLILAYTFSDYYFSNVKKFPLFPENVI